MKRMSIVLGVSVVAAISLLGCADQSPPPKVAITSGMGASTSVVTTTKPAPSKDDDTTAHVVVDPRIQEACNMPTPKFEFDSSAVRPDPALDILATCFTKGPMSGKDLRLVGHADPRGDFEYNLSLGHRRAGNVASYLHTKGLENERVATTSRGEMDATGQDESGWSQDRRVDIMLAD